MSNQHIPIGYLGGGYLTNPPIGITSQAIVGIIRWRARHVDAKGVAEEDRAGEVEGLRDHNQIIHAEDLFGAVTGIIGATTGIIQDDVFRWDAREMAYSSIAMGSL